MLFSNYLMQNLIYLILYAKVKLILNGPHFYIYILMKVSNFSLHLQTFIVYFLKVQLIVSIHNIHQLYI